MYEKTAVLGSGITTTTAAGIVATGGVRGWSVFAIAFWVLVALMVWGLGYLAFRKFRKTQQAK